MPVNASIVGKVYPADEPYTISREKIREFADAVKDPNPAYRSVEAARALGYADLVVPPTFPIVFTGKASERVFLDPEAGIDYGRVVHGEQKFAYQRPLVAGDVVSTRLTIADVRVAAGNEMITSRADCLDAHGELIVSATMLIVVRGGAA